MPRRGCAHPRDTALLQWTNFRAPCGGRAWSPRELPLLGLLDPPVRWSTAYFRRLRGVDASAPCFSTLTASNASCSAHHDSPHLRLFVLVKPGHLRHVSAMMNGSARDRVWARRRVLAAITFLSLCWVGCALSLEEIGTFPCAKDGTCPADYACAAEKGCVKDLSAALPFSCETTCPGGYLCKDSKCAVPEAGSPCTPTSADRAREYGNVDCTLAGNSLVCSSQLGACAKSCSDDRECTSGETCLGVCAKKCNVLNDCPLKVRCEDTYAGAKVCANTTFAACRETTLTACASAPAWNCEAESRGVSCSTTAYCPKNTTCLSGSRCSGCPAGFTGVYCATGVPCTGCEGASWGCRPNTAQPPGCDTVTGKVWQGTCSCTNGKKIPVTCNDTESCETLCAAATKTL